MTEMTERLKPLGEMFGLPQDFNEDTKDKVTELKISHLKDYHKGNLGENRYSKQDLEDLVESVKINGIIQPLVVRPLNENDEYEIILGHHRRDAALLAGLNTVPCLINDDLDDDTAELLFIDVYKRQAVYRAGHNVGQNRAERKEWKSDTKVLKKQVQYARKNHVDGFAFFDYQDLKSKTSAKAVNQLKTVLK